MAFKNDPGAIFQSFFCTKSSFDTLSLHLLGHLSVLRAGGPQHISMWDQNDLCGATKQTPWAYPAKVTKPNPIVIASHTWHLESGRELTGAGAFLASMQLRQEGNNGLKRRPSPFRKTLLERL